MTSVLSPFCRWKAKVKRLSQPPKVHRASKQELGLKTHAESKFLLVLSYPSPPLISHSPSLPPSSLPSYDIWIVHFQYQMICSSFKWPGTHPATPAPHCLSLLVPPAPPPLRGLLSWISYLSFSVSCWFLFPPAWHSPLLPVLQPASSFLRGLCRLLFHPSESLDPVAYPQASLSTPRPQSRHFSWAPGPMLISNCLLDLSNLTS